MQNTIARGAAWSALGNVKAITIPFITTDGSILVRGHGTNVSGKLWNTPDYCNRGPYWLHLEPSFRPWSNICRRHESPHYRVRTRLAYTSASENPTGLLLSLNCISCGSLEAIPHILSECQLYTYERAYLPERVQREMRVFINWCVCLYVCDTYIIFIYSC